MQKRKRSRRHSGLGAWGRKGTTQGRTRRVHVIVDLWRTEGGYCAQAADRRFTDRRGKAKLTMMACGPSPRGVYAAALERLARKAKR